MNRRPYVYELIDTDTGKYYIGSNYSKGCHPDNLGIKYFTSSKIIEPVFRNNTERFIKRILLIGSVDYVVEIEAKLLSSLDAKNDDKSYNGHNGDGKMNCSKFGKLGGKIGGKIRSLSGQLTGMASEAGKASIKARRARNEPIYGQTKAQLSENGRKGGVIAKETVSGIHARTYEQMSKQGKINGIDSYVRKTGIFSKTIEELKVSCSKGGAAAAKVLWKCSECEYTSTAPAMGNHHKFSNHQGKERI